MPPISTKVHGAVDYATGALMLAAPTILRLKDRRAAALLRAAGGGILAQSALTDYELGLRRRLPMSAHLLLDTATGALLASAPLTLRRRGESVASWLPHAALGVGEIAAAALTRRRPGDRAGATSSSEAAEMPSAPTGDTGTGTAAAEPAAGLAPSIAPAPLETPGPSVPAPALPESETEREEWADANVPDAEALGTSDPDATLIAQEESAAAAEAAAIGGVVPHDTDDPAMIPLYEAGEGEAEGFEAAEADLIENATHGDGHGDPLRDAISPEAEADESTAVYGETNRIPSTEVTDDPDTDADDPGAGPGLGAERGTGVQPRPDRARAQRGRRA